MRTQTRRRSQGTSRLVAAYRTLSLSYERLEDRPLLAVITPFTPRFTINATGDIAIAANTLMTAPPNDPSAVGGQNGVGSKINNNDFNSVFVDVDSDSTTFDSSTSALNLPAGAAVLFAGLYWGGRNPNTSLQNQVKFRTPASGGYLSLTGTTLGTSSTSNGFDYQAFADVTSLVQAAGNGNYTLANVQAKTGSNTYAGWSMIVVYQAPGLPARNLTVFDGYASVGSGEAAVTGTIRGFVTPPSGPVDAKVGVVAYEGDRGLTGDSMSLDGVRLSDAANPVNNFFNSSISNLGANVTTKSPNYINQLGYDAKIVSASGIVPNGATSATFQLQTSSDQYFPGVVTLAVNLFSPQISAPKTATDLTNSGPVQPGDVIRYTLTIRNGGQDGAGNTVLTDPIPANTQYVPGSLQIISGANSGAKTDAAGDDQAEFDAAGNRVVFRLGAGANAAAGGTLAIGDTTTIQFDVRVNPDTPDQTVVDNQATITAVGITSNFPLTVLSDDANFLVHPVADVAVTKSVNNPTPNVGDTITYTVNAANLGPSPATNVQITDLLPAGLTFVSATPSQGTYNATTGVWTVGTVTTAAPQTLVIRAVVVGSNAVTNTAAVTNSDEEDPNSSNNLASVVETPQQADLGVAKFVDNPNPNVGDTVAFTVQLQNAGPNVATNVQITDLLPAGLTFVSATPSQGTYSSTSGVWNVGTVDQSGGVRTLIIRAVVASAAAQTNRVGVSHSDQLDPNPVNNQASVTETPQTADLALAKTVSNATPNVGDTITYTVTLTNNGNNTATNVQVTDLLPNTVTFLEALPSQGTYDPATGVWNVGTVAVGTRRTLRITAQVIAGNPGVNTATVTHADQFDPNTSNNTATSPTDPLQADLSVAKEVNDPTPNVGDSVTFTVTLTDNGPSDATGVTLQDLLPAGLNFESALPSQGTYDPATGVWTVGTVPNGSSPTLVISALVASAAATTNTAAVAHSDQFDPNSGNDSASATVTPQQADLSVIKVVTDTTPNVGDTVVFIVGVVNNGPNTATNVTVQDVLPAGLTFIRTLSTQGTYDSATGVWAVGTVTTSKAQVLEIAARVTGPSASTNTATIAHADQFDPVTSNNTASAVVTPEQADLAVSKTVSDPTPNVGDTITYTVTLTDNGPNAATHVRLSDLLPSGVSFVSATTNGGTYDSGTGIWNVGTVSPSVPATLRLTGTVLSPSASTNTATVVGADQFDPNTANNTASATVTPQQADLVVTKSVNNPSPNVGDTIVFSIDVSNNGPNNATNVRLSDLLPAGLSFVLAVTTQGTYDATTGLWDVGTVDAGSSQSMLIQAQVIDSGPQTNTVTVAHADQFDPVTSNNSAGVVETPQLADVAVSKTVDNPTPNVGDTIVFTVTLTNTGPNTATNVLVSDTLPAGLAFVSATASQGFYDPTTGLWFAGTVTTSAPQTLEILATVLGPGAIPNPPDGDPGNGGNPPLTTLSPQTNTATIVHSDQFDPNTVNNTTSVTETPQQADLALAKTVNNPTPNVGDTITFTVTLTSVGPSIASDVQVTDLLPAGLVLLGTSASQGTYDAGTGVWTVGSVVPNSSRTLTLVAKVVNPDAVLNTATITHADQFDPNPNNNTATSNVSPLSADLAVTKTVSDPTPNVGDTIAFTVTLTDNGPGVATGVALRDLLPAGLDFVSALPSQGTYDSATGIWAVGTVPNGSSVTLVVNALVTGVTAATNTATITQATQFDPNPGNNSGSVTVTPEQADLSIIKVVSDTTPNVGDTVVFIVGVINNGPNTATNVTVQDVLPAGLTFIRTLSTQGTYDSATGVWAVGTVTTSKAQVLEIAARVTSPSASTNTATIAHADQFDPVVSNNTASAVVTPEQADLAVTKTVSDPIPNVGDTVTYTVTLTDNGPNSATNVRINDLLPSGVSFISAAPTQGSYDPTGGVWNVGTVNLGSPATLVIRGRVTSPGPQNNAAAVAHSDQFDPNPNNNTANALVTPQQADLAITKTVSDPTPNVGDVITYTVTLTDNGPSNATGVRVSDLLPASAVLVAADPSAGNYDVRSGVWSVGNVASGSSATLLLTVRVATADVETNTATVSRADQFDPNPANNSATVVATPQQADLAITKTVSNPTPNVGDVITYTVTLTDNGPDSATNVQLQDILPSGLDFVSATPSQGAYDSTTGLWAVGTVDPTTPQTLVILARVISPGPQNNTVEVIHTDHFDPGPDDNTTSVIETPQQADLELSKSVSNPAPNVGDTVTFTVTLTNNGPDTATGVQVTDVLPAGVAFVSATPAQGSYDPVTGLWDVGGLPNGSSVTLLIDATITVANTRTNTATVTHSDQFDPDPSNNNANAAETPQQADLAVTKTVSDPTPNVGELVTFTIGVRDLGPSDATNVVITDLLPAGLAFVSFTVSSGTYDRTRGIWAVGDVPTGTSQSLLITARVTGPNATTNQASVSHADQFDANPANNSAVASLRPQQADLALAKSVSDTHPNVGELVTYTITLSNNGPNAATGVQVTDLLPAGMSFASATPSQGTYNPTTGLWDVGALATGSSVVLSLQATVVSPAPQTNTATVTRSDQFDPVIANNTANVLEIPQQADLTVTKSVDNPTPNVGDILVFTVTLTNTGPDAATNVLVTDQLPQGLTFVSATPTQGTYDAASGLWTVGTVNPGSSIVLLIRATVTSSDPQTNGVTVTHTDQFDPDPNDNTTTVTETPQQADLALAKTVSNPTPNLGETITYTVTLTDNGPGDASGVEVTDILPAGVSLVSAAPSAGTYNSATGVWTVGTVTTSTPLTLVLTATVNSPSPTANTAAVTRADQFDPDPTNNSASATEAPRQADLAVSKTVSNATPNVGETITYTVTLTNNGPDTATNVLLRDRLPRDITFVSATASEGTYDAATGIWTVGSVTTAAPQTLIVTAVVAGPDPRTNSVTIVQADQFDPNLANNSASVTETPPRAELAIVKTVSDPTPRVGDTITFTVTVVDNGPDTATGVQVSDLLQAGLAFVSATPRQGTYDLATDVWSVGTVEVGSVATLTIRARVVSPNPQLNTVAITRSNQFDPIQSNNSNAIGETPLAANLGLSKTVDNTAPNVGDTITYTVTLTNSGPDSGTDIQVTDRLPIGLAFVSATPSQGTYDPATGVWNVGTVPLGSQAVLVVQARVTSPGALSNTAMITHTDEVDPDPGNNSGVIVVIAAPPPTVTSLDRFGFHHQPTELVVSFSTALDPARAQDPSSYLLTFVGPHGRVGRQIPLASVVYSSATNTVTLRPAARLNIHRLYRLVINGTPPNGLTSDSGAFLDGVGSGVPGTNYQKIFGRSTLAGPFPGSFARAGLGARPAGPVTLHSRPAEPQTHRAPARGRVEHTPAVNAKTAPVRLHSAAVDSVLRTMASPRASRIRFPR